MLTSIIRVVGALRAAGRRVTNDLTPTMSTPFLRTMNKVSTAIWCSTPETPNNIVNLINSRIQGVPLTRVEGTKAIEAAPVTSSHEDVAVVRVHGIIGKRLSALETECGGCDVDAVRQDMEAAMSNASVAAIVMHFDSPGGIVSGVAELAAKVREWAAQKPIVAYVDDQCCSAAYWLASACTRICCTTTAVLGSVGVYVALVDKAEAFSKAGYKLKLIKAGEYKGTGIDGKEITAGECALIQSDVDDIYAQFVADIRAARPGIADETMQGQCFRGAKAVAAQLADGIVPDMDGAIFELAQAVYDSAAPASKTKPIGTAKGASLESAQAVFESAATSAKPTAPVPAAGSKISSGSGPKSNVGTVVPTPKTDAEAYAIWCTLKGPTRTKFYNEHDQAIWRGKRAADKAERGR